MATKKSLMEELAVEAFQLGAKTENDVVAYVKTNMSPVDELFVRRFIQDVMGEPDFAS